jgi:hypothetical protein
MGNYWTIGRWQLPAMFGVTASMVVMTSVAIDRFISVKHPFL